MELSSFYAVTKETAPLYVSEDTYREVNLYRYNVGKLNFPERIVGVSDGIILQDPLQFPAPAQEGDLWVTLADVSEAQDRSHLRSAYLSVLFSDEQPSAVVPAVTVNGESDLGIPVDAGSVGFYPPEALLKLEENPEFDAEEFSEEIIDALFEAEKEPSETLIYDLAQVGGEGFIGVSSSGWGDGFYGVARTLDFNGNTIGYHVDFGVVGELEDE